MKPPAPYKLEIEPFSGYGSNYHVKLYALGEHGTFFKFVKSSYVQTIWGAKMWGKRAARHDRKARKRAGQTLEIW